MSDSPTTRLFIADLHLPMTSSASSALLQLITNNKTLLQQVDELYILGDLFDYWINLDFAQSECPEHIQALTQLKQINPAMQVFFQKGNRDFLMTAKDAQQLGMILIPDPYYIADDNILLTHGDNWLTDWDYRLMKFLFYRNWLIQLVHALPKNISKRIAHSARKHSKGNRLRVTQSVTQSYKNPEQADLNQQLQTNQHQPLEKLAGNINSYFHSFDYPSVDWVICGHFHKAGSYQVVGKHSDDSSGFKDSVVIQLGHLIHQKANETDEANEANISSSLIGALQTCCKDDTPATIQFIKVSC